MPTDTPIVWTNGRPCVACTQTKKLFDRLGIPFVERVLTSEDLDRLRTEKARLREGNDRIDTAPVVEWGGDIWDGYRPDHIRELVGTQQVAQTA